MIQSKYIPSSNSNLRIMGILIQFAAQHATKGTILPTNGGNFFTIALRPKAVPKAPPVAQTYEVPRSGILKIYIGIDVIEYIRALL